VLAQSHSVEQQAAPVSVRGWAQRHGSHWQGLQEQLAAQQR